MRLTVSDDFLSDKTMYYKIISTKENNAQIYTYSNFV